MKILFITPLINSDKDYTINADYLSDFTLHGLRELYGSDVIDCPGAWYLYKDELVAKKYNSNLLWGKGFTYKDILNDFNKIDRSDIKNKIKKNYFDLIIYGSIQRSKLYFEEAINSKSKIIFIDGEDHRYIKYEFCKYGKYFKRELLNIEKNIFPISFSIPKVKIAKNLELKPNNILAPLIPGKIKTYIYNNENEYYNMYKDSIFAITYKKAGWDCLRHYEILMNGCIPLFFNLSECPVNTMVNLPKKLLLEINLKFYWILNQFNPLKIYKKKFMTMEKFYLYLISFFKKKYNNKILIDQFPEIDEIRMQLYDYTKNNLTTEIAAKKILEK